MKAKKIIIPVSIIAGIAVIGGAIAALGSAASTVAYADTIKIQEKTIENKISVSGTIESAEVKKVYSKLNYAVEKVNVSVGDAVKKGDVLCTISTEDLQQQILQQQTTVDNSGVSEEYNLSTAEEKYNDALEAYNNGENASVMSAQKAVENAEKALENAKRDEKLGLETSLPNAMENAEIQLENAELEYKKSKEAYEKAVNELKPENHPALIKPMYEEYTDLEELNDLIKSSRFMNLTDKQQKLFEKYGTENIEDKLENAKTQYDNAIEGLEASRDAAETAMNAAEKAYNNALKALENAKQSNETSEENYSIAVNDAEKALDEAKKNYELAVKQAESELASLKKAAEQQRTISGLNDPQVIILENLKKDLEYAVVTAPCDGIVTAVNAEEGLVANGVMFIVEDLSSLKVSASVGEYDIPYIAEGMQASVKCDAVAGVEYEGKVSSVAPTGIPGSSGTTYAIEADIDGEDGKILVGMSAKLAIISDKRENALTVTYDALTTDDDGNDAVYVAVKDENGVYHAKLVTVEIGLETDYEIEIISSEISAGMYVLTNTTMLSDGDMVVINESETESEVAE